MRRFATPALALGLTIAALPALAQEFVPLGSVLDEHGDRADECIAPLPDGSACGGFAQYSRQGDHVRMVGVIAFYRDPRLVVRFTVGGRIVDGFLCYGGQSIDMQLVGPVDPLLQEAFDIAENIALMPMGADACSAYFRHWKGGYRLKYYENGAWLPDVPGFDRSVFVDDRPALFALFETFGDSNPFGSWY